MRIGVSVAAARYEQRLGATILCNQGRYVREFWTDIRGACEAGATTFATGGEGVDFKPMTASSDDEKVDRWIATRPPAEGMSAAEFENFVIEVLQAGRPGLENYEVRLHEAIRGVDGEYDFDATVRFSMLGMDYLVLVEDKRHAHPIKREQAQVLHQKLQSVGAQKAVMISTAPFQRGAIEFAKTHGIALVMVSEGRFTFETRAAAPRPTMTREEARERYGIPTFVAVCFGPGDTPGSTTITTIDPHDTPRIQKDVFGIDPK